MSKGRADPSPAADAAAAPAAEAGPVLPIFEVQRRAQEALLSDPSRLHHALLIAGPPGIGKAAFTGAVAQSLLCEMPRAERPRPVFACGRCPACGWFAAGQHPDLRLLDLSPGKDGKVPSEISIDLVRGLEDFVGMTAFRDGVRLIVIDPAETLSAAAANALLKRLEEPGERTVFLLVTHRPDRLPATVRSRCRMVRVPAPDHAAAVAWLVETTGLPAEDATGLLAQAGGAPLHARELADPANLTAHRALLEAIGAVPDTADIVVAERIGTMSAAQWYPVLQRWIGDLIRVRAGATPRFFPESASRLAQLARRSSLAALTQAAIRLQRQANLVRHPLNPRMFAESALAIYADAFDTRGGA